jgi:serine/threonine protein kinase
MRLAPGERLGPFEITEQLGAGGMGEVYRATDTRLGRTVAVKILPEHLAGDPERRERFEREARVVSTLNHPHICILYDVGNQDGVGFLVMEYIEGQTLLERLQKGALPLEQALRYGVEIASALAFAHAHRIQHRDLKPGNIMLTKSGAKLLDFGLARIQRVGLRQAAGAASRTATSTEPLTSEGSILGTLQYMAPEQLEGKDTDVRTDIYALGTVLHEMLTGRRAVEAGSQADIHRRCYAYIASTGVLAAAAVTAGSRSHRE